MGYQHPTRTLRTAFEVILWLFPASPAQIWDFDEIGKASAGMNICYCSTLRAPQCCKIKQGHALISAVLTHISEWNEVEV